MTRRISPISSYAPTRPDHSPPAPLMRPAGMLSGAVKRAFALQGRFRGCCQTA